VLAWPARAEENAKTPRVRGARVVLTDGRPALYVPGRGRKLTTFGDGADLEGALALLRDLPRNGRRWLTIETIDGARAGESRHREALERAGFVRDYRGYAPGQPTGTS
jgi:hypothetical protein